MKKRIQLISKGTKKALCYSALIVLTESQAKKLENKDLIKLIDNVSIDLGVEWAVELSGNYEILAVSRTTFSPIEEEMLKDIEKTAHEFISAVDKLDVPSNDEPECPSHEPDKVNCDEEEKAQDAKTLEFVKELLDDMNLPSGYASHVCGAMIIDTTTHPICTETTCWGKMSYDLLKEMCQLYIEAHDHENG